MTNEISRQEWKRFFDDISPKMLERQTKVEVFESEIGAQVLSEGLPLIGFMFEEKADGQGAIEIMLGKESGAHQTHTISNPNKVFYEQDKDNSDGIIEIEDESGAKTLVQFI